MLLAIDVGNSETLVGLFREVELLSQWRLTSNPRQTGDELYVVIHALLEAFGHHAGQVTGVAVSSVVPDLVPPCRELGRRLTGRDAFLIDHRAVPYLPILYHDPESVGADRLVNAVAVMESHGKPAIVVDLGTATTFDVVNAKGEYAGGAIAAGIATSAGALFQRGARLARVELKRPEHVVGRSTAESVQAGLFYGTVGGVDALVRAIIREEGFPEGIPVVATGGFAAMVAEASETIGEVDETLTVRGIRLVWERAGKP